MMNSVYKVQVPNVASTGLPYVDVVLNALLVAVTTLGQGSNSLPSYTTAKRPAASSLPEGTLIYDSTLRLPIYNKVGSGVGWYNFAGVAV